MTDEIKKAITVVRQGGIIIYPTDTAFGIGCRADDETVIQKLFSIRQRPASQAMPILFDSIDLVKKYVDFIPESVEPLLAKYWPGALTVILMAKLNKIPSLALGGGLSIGCRIPDHEVPIGIIDGLGVPIIGSSANFAGEPTPYSYSEVDPKLMSLVDYVVPGVTFAHKESTVIDCTQKQWKILREGAIRLEVKNLD